MPRLLSIAVTFVASCVLVACGDPGDTSPATSDGGATGADATAADAGDSSDDASDAPVADAADVAATDAPDGLVALPGLPTYSNGACPTIAPGRTTLATGTVERDFELFLPADPTNKPLWFFFYGAGGSTQDYSGFQSFADAYDVVAVVPHSNGTNAFEWPIMATNITTPEFRFFDDMLACITESQPVDQARIYVSGFSAGALWTTSLVMQRSQYFAAAAIFSGGTGELVHGYETPEVPIPILGMWGGSDDIYGGFVNFEVLMMEFLNGVASDGHFLVGCNHGLGHTVPFGGLDRGLEFLLLHRYGDSTSPIQESGLPASFPDYCEIW